MFLKPMRKEKLFTLCIILPIGSMILAVSGISPSKGFTPQSNAPFEEKTLSSSQAAESFLGNEIQISLPTTPECDRYKPAVAYNSLHDEYLVVWHNEWLSGHHDIYARRVSATGQLLSWFSVSAGTNNRTEPAVAYNATNDEYLVVWRYNANGDGATYEIWGKTIAWNGAYQNSEFQIITWANRTFRKPEVVWNNLRNEYFVVWSAFDATTSLATDVAHAILASDGTKLFGTIISSADHPHQADVTFNNSTDEYLVVWRYMSGSQGNIRGARVSANTGVVISPPGEIILSSESNDEQFPVVTTNGGNRYLAVWQTWVSGDWDIHGKELDSDGNVLVTQYLIAILWGYDEMYPDVAARLGPDRDYLVTWQKSTTSGEQIHAISWGDVPSQKIEVATREFWDNGNPAVAWGKGKAMFVYDGNSQIIGMYRHIYGRLWAPHAAYLPVMIR